MTPHPQGLGLPPLGAPRTPEGIGARPSLDPSANSHSSLPSVIPGLTPHPQGLDLPLPGLPRTPEGIGARPSLDPSAKHTSNAVEEFLGRGNKAGDEFLEAARRNPKLNEQGDVSDALHPAAGVRGNDVYKATNTYSMNHTEADGTIKTTTHGVLERPSGHKEIGKLLSKLSSGPSENGVVIKDVVPGTPSNPATFKVEIPDSTPGHPPRIVEVTVEPVPGAKLTPGAHGTDTGPARMDLQHITDASGTGKWTARIELDSALHLQDIRHIIGHEVNELAGIVRQHPTGATPTELGTQMGAGVFRDGSTATKPTAHDIAAARELRSLYEDLSHLEKTKASREKRESRSKSIEQALKWMGLNEASNIDLKLKTLREAGLPQDIIEQVKLVGARAELQTHITVETAAGRTQTIFHDEAVSHLMFPEDPGAAFKGSGINGGHDTQRLLDFANNHERIVVIEQSNKTAGGTTFRKYEQYKWQGPLPKPGSGDPRLPGGPDFNHTDWVKASYPKTTADDIQALMREANAGWENFMSRRVTANPSAAPPGAADDRTKFAFGLGQPAAQAPASGIQFGGYATYDARQGKWILETVFVEETWVK